MGKSKAKRTKGMPNMAFDSSVPRIEQMMRVAGAKEPGRKHQKRAGVRACERRKATQKRMLALKAIKLRQFHSKVSAYWRGELDNFPATVRAKPPEGSA